MVDQILRDMLEMILLDVGDWTQWLLKSKVLMNYEPLIVWSSTRRRRVIINYYNVDNIYWVIACATHCSKHFAYTNSFNPHKNPTEHFHFTNGEIEAWEV